MLDIVFERKESALNYPRRLGPIHGPDALFSEPFSRGDFELLFPFDKETLDASNMLASEIKVDENTKRIIEAIARQSNWKSADLE